MPNNRANWAIGAFAMLFLAFVGAFAYLQFKHPPPSALGLRGDVAIGVALLIVVGKMLLKGRKNKEFKLYEQGEENCLLAVGAAVPTAADYMLQAKAGQGEWLGFAGEPSWHCSSRSTLRAQPIAPPRILPSDRSGR